MASQGDSSRPAAWKWTVCGLLFLATLLNYMDRQTLSQTSKQIVSELRLTEDHYGTLEMAFGLAFACGGLIFGVLADKINIWILYPVVLLGWSAAGFLTGSAAWVGRLVAPHWPGSLVSLLGLGDLPPDSLPTYLGLLSCRIILGLFEAGQWPCALVTTQRLLSQKDRTLGNSLLQSGASIGAILTPIASRLIVSEQVPGSWGILFQSVGAIGVLWIVPWLLMIRPGDLARPREPVVPLQASRPRDGGFLRKFAAVALTVIFINVTWHFYRAWMPLFLGKHHGYSKEFVEYFTVAYFLLTDVGCIAAGFAVHALARRGWAVHRARTATFAICALLPAIGAVAGLFRPIHPDGLKTAASGSSFLPSLPPMELPMLGLLLLVAMGSLALFPIYYSLSQELSQKHQGKVTGTLSCLTWVCTAAMQKYVGKSVSETASYSSAFVLAGLAPVLALVAILLLWPRESGQAKFDH